MRAGEYTCEYFFDVANHSYILAGGYYPSIFYFFNNVVQARLFFEPGGSSIVGDPPMNSSSRCKSHKNALYNLSGVCISLGKAYGLRV